MNNFSEIQQLIAKALNLDPEEITKTSKKSEIPNWDSLGQISIVTTIERRFKIEMADTEVFSFSTPIELCEILEKYGIIIEISENL
jgi:acyl carrier protein